MSICFKTPEIRTKNLILRPLKIEDAKEIYLIRSDIENTRYVEMKPYEDVNRAERFIKGVTEDINVGLVSFWGVCLVYGDMKDNVIGTVCLIDGEDNDIVGEVGYEMRSEYKGKGIMTEAVEAVINFAFNELDLKVVCAETHDDNEASVRLLKHFKFKKDNEESNNMRYHYLHKSI